MDVIRRQKPFALGYNEIVSSGRGFGEMMLDFGILVLNKGSVWESREPLERAFMLIGGKVSFSWSGQTRLASRQSCFDEPPTALQIPQGVGVRLEGLEDGTEICVEKCPNGNDFPPKFYAQSDIKTEIFGAGVLNEASIRSVRTVFDGEIAPFSNMVLGEVINHPGKWSSYPPHDHPHPEIYHYRMFPQQGFGVSILDDEPAFVRDGDTCLIRPNRTHAQVAAPGYAMYYIWMIPHLPGDKWLPTTRYYRREHQWLTEKSVMIWPERPYSK